MLFNVNTKIDDPILGFLIFLGLGWVFNPFPIISWIFYLIAFLPVFFKLWDLYDAIKRYFKSKQAQK